MCDKLCHCFSQSNNNMKPKEGEITSQPWQWPLNWQVTYMLATHALTHTHTHTHTYSYTHTHTHCLSHTYSHTHTHTICTHTLDTNILYLHRNHTYSEHAQHTNHSLISVLAQHQSRLTPRCTHTCLTTEREAMPRHQMN